MPRLFYKVNPAHAVVNLPVEFSVSMTYGVDVTIRWLFGDGSAYAAARSGKDIPVFLFSFQNTKYIDIWI